MSNNIPMTRELETPTSPHIRKPLASFPNGRSPSPHRLSNHTPTKQDININKSPASQKYTDPTIIPVTASSPTPDKALDTPTRRRSLKRVSFGKDVIHEFKVVSPGSQAGGTPDEYVNKENAIKNDINSDSKGDERPRKVRKTGGYVSPRKKDEITEDLGKVRLWKRGRRTLSPKVVNRGSPRVQLRTSTSPRTTLRSGKSVSVVSPVSPKVGGWDKCGSSGVDEGIGELRLVRERMLLDTIQEESTLTLPDVTSVVNNENKGGEDKVGSDDNNKSPSLVTGEDNTLGSVVGVDHDDGTDDNDGDSVFISEQVPSAVRYSRFSMAAAAVNDVTPGDAISGLLSSNERRMSVGDITLSVARVKSMIDDDESEADKFPSAGSGKNENDSKEILHLPNDGAAPDEDNGYDDDTTINVTEERMRLSLKGDENEHVSHISPKRKDSDAVHRNSLPDMTEITPAVQQLKQLASAEESKMKRRSYFGSTMFACEVKSSPQLAETEATPSSVSKESGARTNQIQDREVPETRRLFSGDNMEDDTIHWHTFDNNSNLQLPPTSVKTIWSPRTLKSPGTMKSPMAGSPNMLKLPPVKPLMPPDDFSTDQKEAVEKECVRKGTSSEEEPSALEEVGVKGFLHFCGLRAPHPRPESDLPKPTTSLQPERDETLGEKIRKAVEFLCIVKPTQAAADVLEKENEELRAKIEAVKKTVLKRKTPLYAKYENQQSLSSPALKSLRGNLMRFRQIALLEEELRSETAAAESEKNVTRAVQEKIQELGEDAKLLQKQAAGFSQMTERLQKDKQVWGIADFVTQFRELEENAPDINKLKDDLKCRIRESLKNKETLLMSIEAKQKYIASTKQDLESKRAKRDELVKEIARLKPLATSNASTVLRKQIDEIQNQIGIISSMSRVQLISCRPTELGVVLGDVLHCVFTFDDDHVTQVSCNSLFEQDQTNPSVLMQIVGRAARMAGKRYLENIKHSRDIRLGIRCVTRCITRVEKVCHEIASYFELKEGKVVLKEGGFDDEATKGELYAEYFSVQRRLLFSVDIGLTFRLPSENVDLVREGGCCTTSLEVNSVRSIIGACPPLEDLKQMLALHEDSPVRTSLQSLWQFCKA